MYKKYAFETWAAKSSIKYGVTHPPYELGSGKLTVE